MAINRLENRPRKITFLKVVLDDSSKPPFEHWIEPEDGIVKFKGQHMAVKVDRDAVEMKKNGKPLSDGDSDITFE